MHGQREVIRYIGRTLDSNTVELVSESLKGMIDGQINTWIREAMDNHAVID